MADDDLGRIGGYRLLEQLGRGSTGRVYRAVRTADGSTHAVKVLREDLLDDATATARFRREAESLLHLDHPAVVRAHEVVAEGDALAIVMNLVNGPDLRRLLRERGPLPPSTACAVGAQVARGLAAAHAAGVVHRDLKPENVLLELREDGILARVSDFGVARLSFGASLTRSSHLVGTPDYMAPEAAAGSAVTPAVDVYALGVLLFEAVVGWRPFRGDSPMAVLNQHGSAGRRQPEGLPDALWPVLRDALAVRPTERPDAGALAVLLADLDTALSGVPAADPTTAPEPEPLDVGAGTGTLTRLPRHRLPEAPPVEAPTRRGRLPLAAGLAAVVLGGTAAVAAPLTRHGNDSAAAQVAQAAVGPALGAPLQQAPVVTDAPPSSVATPSGSAGVRGTTGSPPDGAAHPGLPTSASWGTPPPAATGDGRGGGGGGGQPTQTRAPGPVVGPTIRPDSGAAPTAAPGAGAKTGPARRSGQQVVADVLRSRDAHASYLGLDAVDRHAFDDRMLPQRYEALPALRSYGKMPQGISNAQTLPKGYECWDRLATVVAYSAANVKLYSFSALGYWCANSKAITTKVARQAPSRVYAPGWRVASSSAFGSGWIHKPTSVYLRGAHTFTLANVASRGEEAQLVGHRDGSRSVRRGS